MLDKIKQLFLKLYAYILWCLSTYNESSQPSSANVTQVYRVTHCKFGHEYTKENSMINPKTKKRNCRMCHKLANQKYKFKRKRKGNLVE